MARRLCWCLCIAAALGACSDDDGGDNQNANENARCGNGVLEGGEACDEGEANSDVLPDQCRSDCSLPRCGDGVIDPARGEFCDCGDGSGDLPPGCAGPNSDGPGTDCSTRCRVPVCGDGIVEGDETCDGTDLGGETCESLGFAGGSLECFNCQHWLASCVDGCGNLVQEGDEACDGADLGGLQCTDVGFEWGDLVCRETCELDLSGCWNGCGNGRIELAEQCDGADLGWATCESLGFAGGTLACADDCTYDRAGCLGGCGNGILETAESCDDGNQEPWDGCNACAVVEFRVNDRLDCNADEPAVAMAPDGRFVVVWHEDDHSGYQILARLAPAAGVPLAPEIVVSSSQSDARDQPAVAMADDGRFVVAWRATGDGWGSGVYGRRFAADGSALAGEFLVNTNVDGDQRQPAVAMAGDGRFVVAWQGPDSDGDGIWARRFDAGGAGQGAELLVNTSETGQQAAPSLAIGSDGRFVVAWETHHWQVDGYPIFAQRFDAAGVAQGAELAVNETGSEQQRTSPSVSMGGDFGFVVVWASDTVHGNDDGVVGRRFDASGAPLAAEFAVTTVTSGSQPEPCVALASDGRFVVTWQSQGPYPYYDYSITGQRYAADGQAQGGEFQANVFTDSNQEWPAAAMASDGRFVVVWRSQNQEGTGGSNVYAQRYAADGTPRGVLP